MAIMNYDVVIIGGGLSSSMAALRAASLGKKVALIQKAWGSTALGSGAFEIASEEGSYDIISAIDRIKKENPFHPYHYLNTENISQAVELLKKWLPIRMQGSYTENHLFLNDQGKNKKAAFALETQFVDFKVVSRKKILEIQSLNFLNINMLPQTLAKKLDNPEEVRKLGQEIKSKFQTSRYELILMPPILGLDFFTDMKREFESHVGIPTYELLGSINSVPGIRFQKALESAVRKAGVTYISGKAVSFMQEKKKVSSINVTSNEKNEVIEGNSFILATGKFISGGLFRDASFFKETLFHLPLFYQNQKINTESVKKLLRENYKDSQPVFQSGVKVNKDLVPLDEYNEPLFENLRACGTLLQGFDPYQDGTRFGVQILSGYKAADV